MSASDAKYDRLKQRLEDVLHLLKTLPVQSAASDKEPWAKFNLIDITTIIDVAEGIDDPSRWVSEYCGKSFGHTPHHWSDYDDMREPLRMPHYCNGETP